VSAGRFVRYVHGGLVAIDAILLFEALRAAGR
jgi:hypothetical protein